MHERLCPLGGPGVRTACGDRYAFREARNSGVSITRGASIPATQRQHSIPIFAGRPAKRARHPHCRNTTPQRGDMRLPLNGQSPKEKRRKSGERSGSEAYRPGRRLRAKRVVPDYCFHLGNSRMRGLRSETSNDDARATPSGRQGCRGGWPATVHVSEPIHSGPGLECVRNVAAPCPPAPTPIPVTIVQETRNW